MTLEDALKNGILIEDGRYVLFEDGRVFSCTKQKLLIPQENKQTGYLYYDMRYKTDKPKDSGMVKPIHRLIAENFIPNPKNRQYINHIDKNRKNNNIDNLEWVNHSYNVLHSLYSKEKEHKTISACIQLSDTGEIIDTFDSIKSASIKTGINKNNISAVCCGLRKKAGGYKWEYLYENMNRKSRNKD